MTNTIIESPTGSGKTLSLICSSLAWQRAEYGELQKFSLFCHMLAGFVIWMKKLHILRGIYLQNFSEYVHVNN
jgi:hypothetical protein